MDQRLSTTHELHQAIYRNLEAAGIEIPFPHLQLFIDGADGLRNEGGSDGGGTGGAGETVDWKPIG